MDLGTTSLLVIGGHDTGKTHYGGQLLGRLRERESHLKVRGAIENIAPFEEALNKLAQGISARHTPALSYLESVFPIESDSRKLDLLWPDYGGEQITKNIMGQRQIPPEWRSRIQQSDGWLFFIRLEQIRDYNDVLSRPIAEIVMAAQTSREKKVKWSDQAVYVELLQFLLFSKGISLLKKVRKPALLIVLSCWDEMSYAIPGMSPSELLNVRMPLFFEFVNSTWESSHKCIFGLSSLGKSLRDDEPDVEYIDLGPERFGYVVLPDGSRSPDLTLPISKLTQMAS